MHEQEEEKEDTNVVKGKVNSPVYKEETNHKEYIREFSECGEVCQWPRLAGRNPDPQKNIDED